MGAGNSAQKLAEAIKTAESEEELRKLFQTFDIDANGEISKEEFRILGNTLYLANVTNVNEETKTAIMAEFKEKAPMMKGMISKIAGSATNMLADDVTPGNISEWVENMFSVADKDGNGQLSFEEFKTFLLEDSKRLRKEQEAALRGAVADNMDQHGGKLEVEQVKGNTTKSASVSVSAVSSESIRSGQNE